MIIRHFISLEPTSWATHTPAVCTHFHIIVIQQQYAYYDGGVVFHNTIQQYTTKTLFQLPPIKLLYMPSYVMMSTVLQLNYAVQEQKLSIPYLLYTTVLVVHFSCAHHHNNPSQFSARDRA